MKEKEVWSVLDSTKINSFMTCPRMYFYEHILGWRIESPPHDLHFGESWHRAREHMLLNGYDDLAGAFNAFIQHYREAFPEETDELYIPKTPEAVMHAIPLFAERYHRDLEDNELLYTECSGNVPISNSVSIYYRMDSVLRTREGKYFSWDHKSAKSVSPNWEKQFILGMQGFTYTHCLYCIAPIEDVLGVEFCGTSFSYLKRGSSLKPQGYNIDFKRVPVWKTVSQMNNWLWNVNDYINAIVAETEALLSCKDSDVVLMAFPMNTTSCTKYYGCMFQDFCLSWENPLRKCYEPPLGFISQHWDPREIKATNKLNLNSKESGHDL